VDAGSAKVLMYDHDKLVGSMRAAVGANETQTPMMAAQIRYADVNPYWNIPGSLDIKLIAPRVLEQGLKYLTDRKDEVFADWSADAAPLDPATIDWQAVKDGKLTLHIRQGPGGGNSMGKIKFMMPNKFGIYLHDTPDKTVFNKDQRWISNGCIRLQDAPRLAAWLFGAMPKAQDPNVEERVDLPEAVPVFVTYLTAEASPDGVLFRADPYGRDPAVLARYFAEETQLAAAGNRWPQMSDPGGRLVLQRCSGHGDDVPAEALIALFQSNLRSEKGITVRHLVGGNRDGAADGYLPRFHDVGWFLLFWSWEMFVDDANAKFFHARGAIHRVNRCGDDLS
jgi:hypothetical protein